MASRTKRISLIGLALRCNYSISDVVNNKISGKALKQVSNLCEPKESSNQTIKVIDGFLFKEIPDVETLIFTI